MKVKSLHIYPVKGIHAIDLQEAAVERRGLLHDRRWMIVDSAGKFITQREMPKLATLHAALTPQGLHLRHDTGGIMAACPDADDRMLSVRVWKSEVQAYPAASDVNAWLSAYLGAPVTLVYQGDILRPTSKDWSLEGDQVSFADGFPLLVTNAQSLDDLNARMPHALPMNRFRPNIVVEDAEQWAEDTWKKIKIGDTEIDIAKPCVRCIVTTTDQDAGTRDGNEPIATLKTFRLMKQQGLTGVVFGQNAIPRKTGIIRIGDTVEVLETQNPHVLSNNH